MAILADEIFTQAPAEVTRYFDAKGSRPTFDWRDIAPEEHARTFTVAKTAGFEVLDDIRSAVSDAIKGQKSFEQFRDSLEPVLREKGWWGERLAEDPVNGPRLSQLGSVRRLRTIHWANVSTARAAGEWERIQRTKKFMPFLRYLISSSERRRLEHQGWVGTVLPADDPWWNTHYPPNGWQCKCGVRQLTRRQAERGGYDPDTPAPELDERPWFNKRTGERLKIPRGIDPGWHTNPGLYRQRNVTGFLGDRLNAMDLDRRRIAVADILGSFAFRDMMQNRRKGGMYVPVSAVPEDAVAGTGTNARHVFLSSNSAVHILDEHSDRGLTVDDFANAFLVIGDPIEARQKGNSIAYKGIVDGIGWRVVVKYLADEAWVTSFHRKRVKRK